jgi:hypothetical protein
MNLRKTLITTAVVIAGLTALAYANRMTILQ